MAPKWSIPTLALALTLCAQQAEAQLRPTPPTGTLSDTALAQLVLAERHGVLAANEATVWGSSGVLAAGLMAVPVVYNEVATRDETATQALLIGSIVTALSLGFAELEGGAPSAEQRAVAALRGPEYLHLWEDGYRRRTIARKRIAHFVGGAIGTVFGAFVAHTLQAR